MITKYQLITFLLLLILATAIKSTNKTPNNNTKTTLTANTTPADPTNNQPNQKHNAEAKTNAEHSKPETTKEKSTTNHLSKQTKTNQPTESHKTKHKNVNRQKQTSLTNKAAENNAQSQTNSTETVPPIEVKQSSYSQLDPSKVLHPQYQGHSLGVLIVSYLLIFIVMAIGFKYAYLPKQSLVQILLDLFIVIASSMKRNKNTGYNPPSHNQDVDDSNSITVGYTEDHGKQLFWQRNSVQGI